MQNMDATVTRHVNTQSVDVSVGLRNLSNDTCMHTVTQNTTILSSSIMSNATQF